MRAVSRIPKRSFVVVALHGGVACGASLCVVLPDDRT
jgi:hypothetical protein